jgi:hypothetical protein
VLLALAGAAIPALSGAQAVSWAHQNGSLQSNGSITIKSQSGGSYAGQVNPAGAVAKANQSAVTQPPTVIIQATSSAQQEARPSVGFGSTFPACPSGMTASFQMALPSCSTAVNVFNAGGSNLHFMNLSSNALLGFIMATTPNAWGWTVTANSNLVQLSCGSGTGPVVAQICSR